MGSRPRSQAWLDVRGHPAADMRFLAWAMAGAAAVFGPAAVTVAVLEAGIGWLWAALGLLMTVRAGTLLARFAGDRWIVFGATR